MDFKSDFAKKLLETSEIINKLELSEIRNAKKSLEEETDIKKGIQKVEILKNIYQPYFDSLKYDFVINNCSEEKKKELKTLEKLVEIKEKEFIKRFEKLRSTERFKKEYEEIKDLYENTRWNNPNKQYDNIKNLYTQIKNLKVKSEGTSGEFEHNIVDLEEKIGETLEDLREKRKTSLRNKIALVLSGIILTFAGIKTAMYISDYSSQLKIKRYETEIKSITNEYINQLKKINEEKNKEIDKNKPKKNINDVIKGDNQPVFEGIEKKINTKKEIEDISPHSSKDYIYVVKKGDYLSKIVAKVSGSYNNWREIAEYNKLNNPDRIYPGEKIKFPQKFVKNYSLVEEDYDKN